MCKIYIRRIKENAWCSEARSVWKRDIYKSQFNFNEAWVDFFRKFGN